MKWRCLALLLALAVPPAQAATFYVATNGVASGPGNTIGTAWTETYALANAGVSNTIIFLPGTNYAPVTLGTRALHNGLTLLSANKWGQPQIGWAKIIGSPGLHNVTIAQGVTGITIDGFENAYAYIDGVNFDPAISNCTIRNCWIHDYVHGNPAWVTNSSGTFFGDGIDASAGVYNLLIERCLIENGGAMIDHDHAMYLAGTNITVRNCVARANIGAAIQFYSNGQGTTAGAQVYNNLFYNNGTLTLFVDSIIVYTVPGQTNYFYNNTLISSNRFAVNCSFGTTVWTNNILISPNASGPFETNQSAAILCDYNYHTNATIYSGPHDIVSNYVGLAFCNPAQGKYWLGFSSGARAVANPVALGPVDFFGSTQTLVNDVGAFQYNPVQAVDSRILDPSPVAGADYWSLYKPAPVLAMLGGIKVNGGFKICNGQSPASAAPPMQLNNLPGEILYVDVSASGITNQAGGAIANNAVVSGWGDLSPNKTNGLMQLGGIADPVYLSTTGPTNGPCISFTNAPGFYGIQGYLTNAFSGVTFPQPITIFMVINDPSCCNGDNTGVLFDSISATTAMQMLSFHPAQGITSMNLVSPTSVYLWYGAIGDGSADFGWGYDGWSIVTVQFNGSSSHVYINGIGPRHTINYGPNYNPGNNGLLGFTLANSPSTGGRAAFNWTSRVSYTTVIICTGSSYTSGSLRLQVEETLGKQYNITVP